MSFTAASVDLQFYEKLSPGKGETEGAADSAPTDIATAIADEVAELKDKDKRVFVYHKTNVNGLVYLSMKSDAGPVSQPRPDISPLQPHSDRMTWNVGLDGMSCWPCTHTWK